MLNQIFEHCPLMVVAHRAGIIVYANQAAEARMLKEKDARWPVGHALADFLHPDDLPESQRRVAAMYHGRETSAFVPRQRLVTENGAMFYCEATVFVARLEEGLTVISMLRELPSPD